MDYHLNDRGKIKLKKNTLYGEINATTSRPAKKTTKKEVIFNPIEEVGVGDFVMDKGILYGINRNVGRDIPWIYDGLVSVERRILFIMHSKGLTPKKKHEKVSSIIGSMMEQIYPHSDKSPEKTLARLGRDISTMIPYIDGKGNFGDPYTKEAAAGRYIQARLSEYSQECFFSETDTSKPIVDMKDNYAYTGKEPIYLATKYPNALMQWNSGIGNGTASTLPAFNSIDILETAIRMIDDPDCHVDIYPDTPVPVDIINKKELKGCFDKHKFSIKMEGQYRVESIKGVVNGKAIDKNFIIFTSCPVNSSPKAIEKTLTSFDPKDQNSKIFKEIKDVNVKAQNNELEFFIEYEKGYDPTILAEKIMKKTDFGNTVSAQFVLIKDNQPHRYTPRTVLLEWLNIRIDQKRRYIHQKIVNVLTEKLTIEALLIILNTKNGIEKAISIIKKSKTDEDTIAALCKEFKMKEIQARYVSNLRLKTFNKANSDVYRKRMDELEKTYKYYRSIADEDSIRKVIKDELKDGMKYAKPRKAKLLNKTSKGLENASKILVYNKQQYFCLKDINEITKIANKIDKTFDTVFFENVDKIFLFDETGTMRTVEGYSFTFSTDGISFDNILGKDAQCIKVIKPDKSLEQITMITDANLMKTIHAKDLKPNGRIIKLAAGAKLHSVIPTKAKGIVGIMSGDRLYYMDIKSIPVLKASSVGSKVIKTSNTPGKLVFFDNASEFLLIYGENGYCKNIGIKYLSFAKKKDNFINMGGKNIFGIKMIKNGEDFVVYDKNGHRIYSLIEDNLTTFIVDKEEMINNKEKYKPVKFKLSTSAGTSSKVFKYTKNDYYHIQ